MTRKQELTELANANEVEVAERDTADDIAAKLQAAGVDVPEHLAADESDEPASEAAAIPAGSAPDQVAVAPGSDATVNPAATAREAIEIDPEDLKNDDQVPAVVGDAEVNDAPVRTGEPDTPVVTSLATGAGAHTPPDPDTFGTDGRPLATPSTAFAEPDEEAQERATRERETDSTDRY